MLHEISSCADDWPTLSPISSLYQGPTPAPSNHPSPPWPSLNNNHDMNSDIITEAPQDHHQEPGESHPLINFVPIEHMFSQALNHDRSLAYWMPILSLNF